MRKFLLGLVSAVLLLFGLAEIFLRLSPPKDLQPFLGEESSLTGPFVPDDEFCVAYRDFAAFQNDNAGRLAPFMPLNKAKDHRPLWAMFGSSFVHMEGMLADTARKRLPDHHIFNLGKNEHLYVRLAQIKLLLENGFKPDRIIFTMMPIETIKIGEFPLAMTKVTSQGAIVQTPRPLPGFLAWSRLALTAQVRFGWHQGNPRFSTKDVVDKVDPILQDDLRRLFKNFGELTNRHGIPATVVLIPTYHQIHGQATLGFQDTLGPLISDCGLNVLDLREAYLHQDKKAGLFIPDRHFSARGNQILLDGILEHFARQEGTPRRIAGRREP